jgi:predicted outer membrane lipoprotein
LATGAYEVLANPNRWIALGILVGTTAVGVVKDLWDELSQKKKRKRG